MSAVASAPPRRAWRALLRAKLALIDRRQYERVVVETIGDMSLVVLPDVFNPKLLRSGEFLVSQLHRLQRRAYVLDLGCGSGAAGVAAARRGCRVVGTDINPSAVRCARINALLNDVELDLRQGDLFAPVADERFDVVLFNPPYYRGDPKSGLDHAWRSRDVPERFAVGLARHLTAEGYALVVLSTDGDDQSFLTALRDNGFEYDVAARHDFINEVMSIYDVRVRAC